MAEFLTRSPYHAQWNCMHTEDSVSIVRNNFPSLDSPLELWVGERKPHPDIMGAVWPHILAAWNCGVRQPTRGSSCKEGIGSSGFFCFIWFVSFFIYLTFSSFIFYHSSLFIPLFIPISLLSLFSSSSSCTLFTSPLLSLSVLQSLFHFILPFSNTNYFLSSFVVPFMSPYFPSFLCFFHTSDAVEALSNVTCQSQYPCQGGATVHEIVRLSDGLQPLTAR